MSVFERQETISNKYYLFEFFAFFFTVLAALSQNLLAHLVHENMLRASIHYLLQLLNGMDKSLNYHSRPPPHYRYEGGEVC